jgi:hypothetical protein
MATDVIKEQSTEESDNYSDKVKQGMDWLKQKGQDVINHIESTFDTVSGRAALQQIAAYAQESEAVNTAMATRIYDLLDREARLQVRVAAAERKIRQLIWVTVAVSGITWVAILYLLAR